MFSSSSSFIDVLVVVEIAWEGCLMLPLTASFILRLSRNARILVQCPGADRFIDFFFSSLSVTFFCFIPSGFVSGYAIEIGRKAIILLAVLSVGGPSSSERRGKCGRAGTMEGNYPLDDVDILQRPGDE